MKTVPNVGSESASEFGSRDVNQVGLAVRTLHLLVVLQLDSVGLRRLHQVSLSLEESNLPLRLVRRPSGQLFFHGFARHAPAGPIIDDRHFPIRRQLLGGGAMIGGFKIADRLGIARTGDRPIPSDRSIERRVDDSGLVADLAEDELLAAS